MFVILGLVFSLEWELIFTIVGGILSFIYFVQKQKLEEIRLLKELFTDFNARYDALNEELNRIASDNEAREGFTQQELDTIYNYFNLCGEEYFYYEQGYIHPKVWKAWRNGMKIFYRNERIRKAWAEELKNDSYYGFQLSLLEKD
jgi:hypothetical protein